MKSSHNRERDRSIDRASDRNRSPSPFHRRNNDKDEKDERYKQRAAEEKKKRIDTPVAGLEREGTNGDRESN
jgi:hypothetical protein